MPQITGQFQSAPITGALYGINNAMQATGKGATRLSAAFGSMGNVASFVFGSVLGLSAITILQDIIGYFQKAAVSAYEFTKAMFSLEVGIRALQRSGIDITIKDVYENIERLRVQFGTFSRKELVEGSASLLNLIRDFGLTKEEIFGVQEAAATLAVVNGRAMDDVQRTIALALSSGYTEGLQRLGVSISKITIAYEAMRLGFSKTPNYMGLNEQQRALATLSLIQSKTAIYQRDLEAYQKTAPGRIDVANKRIEDQIALMGQSLLPVWAAFVNLLATALEIFQQIRVILAYSNPLVIVPAILDQLREGKNIIEAVANLPKRIKEAIIPSAGGSTYAGGDLEPSAGVADEKRREDIEDKVMQLGETLRKIERDTAKSRARYQRDLQNDLEKIDSLHKMLILELEIKNDPVYEFHKSTRTDRKNSFLTKRTSLGRYFKAVQSASPDVQAFWEKKQFVLEEPHMFPSMDFRAENFK
jgi:hypothetical protein